MSLSPGRLAAGRALLAAEQGRHLDDALIEDARLSPEDRALAWHLAFGVCRHRGELDAMIGSVSKRPIGRMDRPVRVALRIGLFDRWMSRTPVHAATDQAVRLCKKLGASHASGFANAVMRRAKPLEGLPASVNHPDWLVRRWNHRYGEVQVEAWCARNDEQAPLSLVATGDPESLRERLVADGLEVREGRAGGERVPAVLEVRGVSGAVRALPGFEAGEWFVMDAAAAAVADLVDASANQRVLDACAAPGGKTLRMRLTGAEITATDRSRDRLELLRSSLKRVPGADVSLREVDWESDPWTPEQPFDAVLVDAPCTALGTTRRHPELRWARRPSDPAAMAIRQARVLSGALKALKPGGTLVYAVCSPEPEEGPQVVRRLLADTPGLSLEAELSFAPPSQDEDAHYAAKLRAPEAH